LLKREDTLEKQRVAIEFREAEHKKGLEQIQVIEEEVKALREKTEKELEGVKLKGVEVLRELLDSAGEQIDESVVINLNAQDLFFNRYILITTSTEESEEPSATSSQTSTTTIDDLEEDQTANPPQEILDEQTDATSTEVDATSTEPLPSPLSIKDLVKDSLAKVKGAYQIFIEMSNLVRKLLN